MPAHSVQSKVDMGSYGWAAFLSVFTFPVGTAPGALIGGLLKGRSGGAVGAILGTALHNVALAKECFVDGLRYRDKGALQAGALCMAPTAATALLAGAGFLLGGPLGALIGSLVPTAALAGYFAWARYGPQKPPPAPPESLPAP